MVVIDHFSKYAYFLPTNTTVTSKGIAQLCINHVFWDHGFPIEVISNRGMQFVSQFMKELYEASEIKGNPSTTYHPQTDGQMEQVNQEVKEFLMIFVNNKQDNWSKWLPVAQFCHNDRQHSATKYSPFFLNYGWHTRKGIEPLPALTVPMVESFLKNIMDTQNKASTALKEAVERMKIQYNKNKQPLRQYKKGDKVYINVEHLPTQWASKKLDQKYYGPYEVVEGVGSSAYQIWTPMSWKVYNVFNEILLKPYYAPHYPRQKAIEEEKRNEQESKTAKSEYEVEDLLDSRVSKKGCRHLEYLVKWKNYPRKMCCGNQKKISQWKNSIKNSQCSQIDKNKWLGISMVWKLYKTWHTKDIILLGRWQKCEYLERLEWQWQRWKQWGLLDDDSKFVRMQTLQEGWCYDPITYSSP